MKWTKINKGRTSRPEKVSAYGDYKPYLREEANSRCVYCAIHENPGGGYDHFHVEHFRPKSIKRFEKLEKVYTNLFYSCAVCNRFKSNDWPNEPTNDQSNISYPDPNDIDYNDLFRVDENGKITGLYTSSKYVIEKVNLNRPQLINERRESFVMEKTSKRIREVEEMIGILRTKTITPELGQLMAEMMSLMGETSQLLIEEKEISRYDPNDIKRRKS